MCRPLVAAGSLAFDHISQLVFSPLRACAHATTVGDLRGSRPLVEGHDREKVPKSCVSCHCFLSSYSLYLPLQSTLPVPLLSRPPQHCLQRLTTCAVFSCKLQASCSAFVPCALCVQECFMSVVVDAGLIRARHVLCLLKTQFGFVEAASDSARRRLAIGWGSEGSARARVRLHAFADMGWAFEIESVGTPSCTRCKR